MSLFLQLNELGTTVLIASHDLGLIRQMGKRVLVRKNGQLVDSVPARQAPVPGNTARQPGH